MSLANIHKPNNEPSGATLIGGDSIRLDHLDGIRGLMAMWMFGVAPFSGTTSINLWLRFVGPLQNNVFGWAVTVTF